MSAGNFPIEFRLRIMGDQEVIAKIRAVSGAVAQVGAGAAASTGGLNQIKPALTGVGTEAGKAVTPVKNLGSGFSVVDGATSSTRSSLGQIVPAFRGVGENSRAAGAGMERFSSRASQSASASDISKTAVQGLGNQMRNAAGSFSAGLIPMASMGAATERTAGSMERSGQSTRRTTQDYVALGGRLGGVVLSATLMFNALDEANGMQQALAQAQARASQAQMQYNQAVKDFGPKSHEATQALQRLEKANIALQYQQRNTGFAIRDVIPIAGLMVTQAIEPMIKGISKLGPILSSLRGSFGGIRPAAMELTGALAGLTVGGGGSAALAGISGALGGLAGKFGGVVTAIAPFTSALSAAGPVLLVVYQSIVGLVAIFGSLQSVIAAAAGKTQESMRLFKGSFDMLKNLGMGAGGLVSILGLAGVDKALEDATGGTKKAGTSVKSMAQDFQAAGMQTTTAANKTATAGQTILLTAKDVEKAGKLISGIGFQPRINAATITAGLAPLRNLNLDQAKQTMKDVEMQVTGLIAGFDKTNPSIAALQGAMKGLTDDANMQAGAMDLLAQAMIKTASSPQQIALGMAQIKKAFADSEQELAKWVAALQNSTAGSQAVSTALNDIASAAIKEGFALQASIDAASNGGIQFVNLSNAVLSGKESIVTWAAGLDDAKAAQDSMVETLAGMNLTFSQLPAGIAPTIDNLKAMHEATEMGGQALFDYKVKAMDAFTSISSTASTFVTDLAAAMRTPTEKVEPVKIDSAKMMQDLNAAKYATQGFVTTMATMGQGQPTAVSKIFDGLSPAVRASFDQAEQAAAIGMANMTNQLKDLNDTFAIDQTFGAGFQQAAQTLSQGLTGMAQTVRQQGGAFNQGWAQVWERAAEIAQQAGQLGGSAGQQMIQNLQSALSSGISSASPASVVLDSLNHIPGAAGQVGTEGGTTLTSRFSESAKQNAVNAVELLQMQNLVNSVGTAAMNAGTAFANGFSAGAVHIAAVITGIQANINNIRQTTPTPLSVNLVPLGIGIAQAQQAVDSVRGRVVLLAVNTAPAQIALGQLQGFINGIVGKSVPMSVNIGPALAAVAQLQGAINGVVGNNVFITVNTGSAGLAVTQIQKAINGVTGKEVAVTVNATQAGEKLNWVLGLLSKIVSKTITVTANVVQTGSAPVANVGGRASGFGPEIVRKPTIMLVGEAGPELVSVVPMQRGTGRGSLGSVSGDSDEMREWAREMRDAMALFRSAVMQRVESKTEANLIVDGHRLSRVSTRHTGNNAYGDY